MINVLAKYKVVKQQGYIAGDKGGVVSKGGVPCALTIMVLNASDLSVVQKTQSLDNGHYLIMGLDPGQQYLIMARDHTREYEPFCWDYITPASDKDFGEQWELWQSWQSV